MAQSSSDVRWLTNAISEDKDLLAGMGGVTIRHTQLDYMLRMTIKTLTGVTIKDALDATHRDGSAERRRRINRLAKAMLGEGPTLVRLQALLERCRRASDKRNKLVHSMWAGVLDKETYFILTEDRDWEPIPKAEDLRKVSRELLTLANELNHARLEGFLHDAINK